MLDGQVLCAIDEAISFPLVFEVVHSSKIKVVAYKRSNEVYNTHRVVWWLLRRRVAPRECFESAVSRGAEYGDVV